ncbi:MAG: GAF domain-containing protein [Pyrinomonadaceae bacterium]
MTADKKNNLEEKLRSVIETVDIANALIEPLTKSIENLLHISSAQMNSEEASVLIRDGDEGDLRFVSAIGKVAHHLINMQVPAGKGVAGFVFSSGQPMAIADVGEEDSFYAEIDKQTGYSTQTLLATPLRHNGEVIGVLEYVNRIGDPPYESFSSEDMDRAAVFAEAVASLVNAYESAKLFRNFTEKMLSVEDSLEFAEVRSWLQGLRDSNERKEMLDLAWLVREISIRGDDERRMCLKILESILEYANNKTETSFLNY